MDFVAIAMNECPQEMVQKAMGLELEKFETIYAWEDITFSDAPPSCLSAIVGMMAKRINKSSDQNLQRGVLSLGKRVAATNGPEVVWALTEMVRRLLPVTKNFIHTYDMLAANRIDMLEELPPIPIEQWEVPNFYFSHEAFLRAVYRLQMDAPLAQEHLAEGLALLSTNIDSLSSHVQFLLDTRPAQLPQLLEPYLDDPRRPRGVYGRRHPIGEYIKAKLKDPLGLPPRDVSNLKRQIFKTEGMR